MIEYNPKENRFPFHTKDKAVSLCFDDTEDIQELDFIYGKIVERYPDLKAENFYTRLMEIERMKSGDKVKYLKASCDSLLGHVKEFLSDERFVHHIHDAWGFGLNKVIETLYAVYGYYFFTGKRTANAIKKTIDGYKRQPVR